MKLNTKKLRNFRMKKLKSTRIYSEAVAKRFHKTKYYKAMASEIKNLPTKDQEKRKMSTKRHPRVTAFIEEYKRQLERKTQGVFHVLKGIYNKNTQAIYRGEPLPTNSNLLSLVASIPLLTIAYKKVRKNRGAMTPAWFLSIGRWSKLTPFQRILLNKNYKAPDRMSRALLCDVAEALKKGIYPWGASRRIYVDKPGRPDQKRPITIPPFMDKVVQSAILMVLHAIYEPIFEHMNCSFGFRPRKGVHDAIYRLTRPHNRGMITALEGDIKGAYDNVSKTKLLEILSQRIKDRKFLNLIKDRLDYQYYDSVKGEYKEDKIGIPQGGTDSPYLWNIYMLEFDKFVNEHVSKVLEDHNTRVRGNASPVKNIIPKDVTRLLSKRKAYKG